MYVIPGSFEQSLLQNIDYSCMHNAAVHACMHAYSALWWTSCKYYGIQWTSAPIQIIPLTMLNSMVCQWEIKKTLMVCWQVMQFIHKHCLVCNIRISSFSTELNHCFVDLEFTGILQSVISEYILFYWVMSLFCWPWIYKCWPSLHARHRYPDLMY